MNSSFKQTEIGLLSYSETRQKGFPIVFIHGNCSSKETFVHQFNDPQFKDFRLFALDLPGHGESDISTKGYRIETLLSGIIDLLAKKGITEPILVGHSLGGHIAIHLSKKIEVSGLFLFGMAPVENEASLSHAYQAENLPAPLFSPQCDEEGFQKMAQSFFERPEDNIQALIDRYQNTDVQWRTTLAKYMLEDFKGELRHLKTLNCPIHFLIPDKEPLINCSYLEENFKSEEFSIVKSSSHFPHFEYPKLFNQILRAYLKEVSYTLGIDHLKKKNL